MPALSPNLHPTDEHSVLNRVRKFNASLEKLMRLYAKDTVSHDVFMRNITFEACELLATQRVSIWLLNSEKSSITCSDLYVVNTNEHTSGAVLKRDDFPDYFESLLADRVIDAVDAAFDPRTKEFRYSYLEPNNIFSMLDAQILSSNGARGVVCVESVNIKRQWTPDEIAYVASVSEIVGFYLDRKERIKLIKELEFANNKLERAVAQTNEIFSRYTLAIDAALEGVWDWHLNSDHVHYSKQNLTMLGEAVAPTKNDIEVPISWWKDRIHPQDLYSVLRAHNAHLEEDVTYDETYRIKHNDGSWRWWRSRGRAIRNENGEAIRFVGTNSDVTNLVLTRKELERKNDELTDAKHRIEYAAYHDSLTGLPNRRYMDRELENLLKKAKCERVNIAFLHIDLDYFKEVNDSYGHAVGDYVIELVAKILKNEFKQCFVARIGGDEFVAVMLEENIKQPWLTKAETVIDKIRQPIICGTSTCRVGASIGIAELNGQDLKASQMLGNADLALYAAKGNGRNRYARFTHNMRQENENKRALEAEIIKAIEQKEFIPYFQPQFSAKTRQLVGVEVLVRWQHPTKGLLNPPSFLSVAESLGCVGAIDELMLEKALAFVREWKRKGLNIPRLSVNVSSARLSDPKLTSSVKALNIPKGMLCFELLESIFLDETDEQVSQNLTVLNEMGVQIEVDDFGTGYASILSLINIRPHRLKVDRSLVRHIEHDEQMAMLVHSIVDIASTLNIEVVAEGVESQSQARILAEIGCDVLQGFELGRPVSADLFFKLQTEALIAS